jgi:hypothetical protein
MVGAFEIGRILNESRRATPWRMHWLPNELPYKQDVIIRRIKVSESEKVIVCVCVGSRLWNEIEAFVELHGFRSTYDSRLQPSVKAIIKLKVGNEGKELMVANRSTV